MPDLITPPPTSDHWMRLTDLADRMGLSHAAAREAHEALGRPYERLEPGRGRAVQVNTPYWLRVWRWYHVATERVERLQTRGQA